MTQITAKVRSRRVVLSATVLLVLGAAWAFLHAISLLELFKGQHKTQFQTMFMLAFLFLAWQMVLAYREKPFTTTPEQDEELAKLFVVVNVPLYNEDPEITLRCLDSIISQSRKPDVVHVVNDGSTAMDYFAVMQTARRAAARAGVTLRWDDKPNGGKRSCQAMTFRRYEGADIYVTVDSDAVLAPNALEEGLKPFADPRTQSVGAVVMAYNASKNLLCRLTDLWFTVGQLTDRSSMSTMGSVLVNSGPLALYRGQLVRDHLPAYTNETFMGRRVEFSDDSLLTLFAVVKGRAVQQPTCYAFTLMPEHLSHHVRQYTRWMRGAFIRSVWRFRYLPLNRYAYWAHFLAWSQTLMGLFIFGALFIYQPITKHDASALPWLMIVPLLIGYAQALRYISVERSDQTAKDRWITYAISPISSLWAFFVLRFVRIYGIFTCRKTGWGTRAKIEVAV